MKISVETTSLPIVICTKDLTSLKCGTFCKWVLYDDLKVKYEWHCPEKDNYRKQDIDFENLPSQIQIMIAKQAIKSPLIKMLESKIQLKLVLLAVKNQ